MFWASLTVLVDRGPLHFAFLSGNSVPSGTGRKDECMENKSIVEMQDRQIPQIVRVIDGTVYTVNIHFKENAKESVRDKIMRLIRKEVEAGCLAE